MKNSIILFVSILIFLSSCNKDKVEIPSCQDCDFTCLDGIDADVYTNECRTNWTCDFKVLDESKISTEEREGVISGDKTVFQMIQHTEGEVMIADDEFTEILVFELDATQESFSVEDSELANMQVHFKRICFCPNQFNPIVEGCLQGEKQADGTWFVQGYINGDMDFGVDAQFSN